MGLKEREKIIILIGALAVAFWGFDFFYYTPQKKKIMNLKAEIQAAENKSKESAILRTGVENLELELSRLEKQLQGHPQKVLQGEEFRAFLKQLAGESARLQMKMISLSLQEEKLSPSPEKKASSSLPHRRVAVHLVLHATYNALGNYLKGIQQLPFLVTLDLLQVERKEELLPFLVVTLELGVRVFSLEAG